MRVLQTPRRRAAKNGDRETDTEKGTETETEFEWWATNYLDLERGELNGCSGVFWRVEECHRGLKQCCGVERSQVQVRFALGQVRHIGLTIRAFIGLEFHGLRTGLSWYKVKRASYGS